MRYIGSGSGKPWIRIWWTRQGRRQATKDKKSSCNRFVIDAHTHDEHCRDYRHRNRQRSRERDVHTYTHTHTHTYIDALSNPSTITTTPLSAQTQRFAGLPTMIYTISSQGSVCVLGDEHSRLRSSSLLGVWRRQTNVGMLDMHCHNRGWSQGVCLDCKSWRRC